MNMRRLRSPLCRARRGRRARSERLQILLVEDLVETPCPAALGGVGAQSSGVGPEVPARCRPEHVGGRLSQECLGEQTQLEPALPVRQDLPTTRPRPYPFNSGTVDQLAYVQGRGEQLGVAGAVVGLDGRVGELQDVLVAVLGCPLERVLAG